MESDPMGLDGGGLSTYSYVDGDPENDVDPNGLAPSKRVRRVKRIDCSADDFKKCDQTTCLGKGTRSCKRVYTFQNVRVKQTRPGIAFQEYAWKFQGLSCDCNEPCKNSLAVALGLAVYVLISEGSRIVFPVRNLVPAW
jgi:hypothetical protein